MKKGTVPVTPNLPALSMVMMLHLFKSYHMLWDHKAVGGNPVERWLRYFS